MLTLIAVFVAVASLAALSFFLLRRRPTPTHPAVAATGTRTAENGTHARHRVEASGRRRATEPRAHSLLVRERGEPAVHGPENLTEEAIGVTRREFFNRSLFVLVGLGLTGAGSAMLAFLWPNGSSTGFGGKIRVTGLTKILNQIETNREPYYVPAARTWLQHYPPSALPKAKRVYKPVVYAAMQQGVVALYQRCPHLGCRVPWCQSSQWFECPCHGSKYNAVGEKKAGPAPRGMDRFPIEFSGDNITINTETVILGPPVGTNTTGQQAAGPLCV